MYDEATLWKLIEGELPPAEADAIRAAADADPVLRQQIAEIEAMKRGILDGAPKPPPGFADRVTALALEGAGTPVFDLADARRFVRRLLVAAAIIGALGLAYLAVEVVPSLFPDQHVIADPLLKGGD